MSVTVSESLEDSIILSADNPAHAADVRKTIERSTYREGSGRAIVDGTYSSAPAIHSAAAKVILGTLDVEFYGTLGVNTVWQKR